jgi:hypothetical protein
LRPEILFLFINKLQLNDIERELREKNIFVFACNFTFTQMQRNGENIAYILMKVFALLKGLKISLVWQQTKKKSGMGSWWWG